MHGDRVIADVARHQRVEIAGGHPQAVDGDQQVQRRQSGPMRGAAFVDIGQLAVIALPDRAHAQRRLAVLALVGDS